MATNSTSPDQGNVVCELCAEYGPDDHCLGGHALCSACVRACRATQVKNALIVDALRELPTPCPIANCLAFLRDASATERRANPTAARMARLVGLDKTAAEYREVQEAFLATVPHATILHIYRVENAALKAIFDACVARMEKEGRIVGKGSQAKDVGANLARLFHGTTRAAAGAIVREGFDAHRAGEANGTALGAGIYVAHAASYSNGYSTADAGGVKTMLVCSVALGDTSGRDSKRNASASAKLAARAPQAAASTIYVVHREQQVLPTHYIQYRET